MDSSTTPSRSIAPDWSSQIEEIHCPLCDYNLRGLTEPRCPECGHPFEWIKLTDPAQRVHPYLFEHHPNRNVWSYAQTVLGAMLPGRFFRSLQPIQRTDRRRLVMSYGLTALLLLAPFAVLFTQTSISIASFNQKTRPTVTANWLSLNPEYTRARIANGLHDADLNEYCPLPPSWKFFRSVLDQSFVRSLIVQFVAIALWPWAAMCVLLLFRASMRKVKIQPAHVLRCTIYSGDPGPVLAAIAVLAGLWVFDRVYPFVLPSTNDPWQWWLTLMIVWSTITWRLVQSYRFLRFPHAIGVVLSVQLICLLLMLQMTLLAQGYDSVVRLAWPWKW